MFDAQRTLTDARALVETIRSTGKPLRALFMTHPHPDHITGFGTVKAAFPDAAIYSTVEANSYLDGKGKTLLGMNVKLFGADATAEIPKPDVLVTDGQRVTVGGLEIQARLLGSGESPGTTVYFIPSLQTLVVGDVLTPRRVPFMAAAETAAWLKQIAVLKANYDPGTHVAPGHGPETTLKDAAEWQTGYLTNPDLPSGELTPVMKVAKRLGGYAFLIRGACTSMFLVANDVKPLSGGRGRVDAEGKGRRAQLRRLAVDAGVSRKTLETDARIYETFFKGQVNSETGDARILSLSREMFVVALAAPDPMAAVQMALEHADEPSYGRQQLRQHIRELLERAGFPTPPTRKRAAPPLWTLSPEAEHVLAELQELSSLGPSSIIAAALIRYRKALKRTRASENSDGTQGAARHNADAAHVNSTAPSSRRRPSPLPETRSAGPEQPTLFSPDILTDQAAGSSTSMAHDTQ